MADYSDLTPEQLLMLRQFGGLLSSGNMDAYSASGKSGNFATSVRGFDTPAAKQAAASAVLGAQVADNARLNAMLNASALSTKQGDTATITPAIMAQLGNLQAMYSQQIADGQRQSQAIGGSVNLGPAQVGVQKTYTENGPNPTAYNIAVPTSFGTVSANMLRGKGMPTSYQGAIEVPGLLGGRASVAAEYTPSAKDKAIYARWKREF